MTATGPVSIAPSEGKLGVLCVGLGAVTSTLIAGVELARRGMGEPIKLRYVTLEVLDHHSRCADMAR